MTILELVLELHGTLFGLVLVFCFFFGDIVGGFLPLSIDLGF